MDEPTLRRLAFHHVFYYNTGAGRRVLRRFSAVEPVFEARPDDFRGLGLREGDVAALTSGRALGGAARELEKIERKGYTLLTLADPGYPGLLREIFDPPFAVYCSGRAEVLSGPAVAIVGSRRPTAYGRALAERLAGDLAARGCAVASGMALGIDTCAHWGALREGRTIAVLGSGLDVLYPRENRGLAEKIAERGAVVTEFPLGTDPRKEHFPVRNRIISGLALGTVIVEAAERSGSLITAHLALEQNREVMAVPGHVSSELSRGTNGLIKEGAALVENWEDVAGALPVPWSGRLLAQKREKEDNSRASLSRDESRLMKRLPPDGAVHIDELAETTGLPVAGLLALLLGLELRGLVVQHPGKYFQRRV
jgi:DNA processing protein